MHDLKMFARNEESLAKLAQAGADFSADTGMKFSLEKCARTIIRRGEPISTEATSLHLTRAIYELEPGETYK